MVCATLDPANGLEFPTARTALSYSPACRQAMLAFQAMGGRCGWNRSRCAHGPLGRGEVWDRICWLTGRTPLEGSKAFAAANPTGGMLASGSRRATVEVGGMWVIEPLGGARHAVRCFPREPAPRAHSTGDWALGLPQVRPNRVNGSENRDGAYTCIGALAAHGARRLSAQPRNQDT